jgi:hypothetical protein
MDRILPLSPPFQGLTKIVNVFDKVGPEERNDTEDVKIVQKLLQMAGKGAEVSIDVPNLTGKFDAATGFWIYHVQSRVKDGGHPNQIVDGVVSPAHGSVYGPKAIWTIVLFNHFANKHDPFAYQVFVDSLSL